MNVARILFVDDEPEWASLYVESLKDGFDVTYFDNVYDSISYVEQSQDIEVIITDLMMPSPSSLSEETASGMETGLWFLGRIANLISPSCSVILLSNRMEASLKSRIENFGINHSQIHVLSKSMTSSRQLVYIVTSIVKGGNERGLEDA